MANSLPNEDGFQEFLSFYTKDASLIQQVEQERVSKIIAEQKPKLSCGIDTCLRISSDMGLEVIEKIS